MPRMPSVPGLGDESPAASPAIWVAAGGSGDLTRAWPTGLRTPRLVLRRPDEGDRALWVRLHRDPALYTHAPHAMAVDDEAASAQFDKVLAHWAEHGFGYQVVDDPASGLAVGVGGLKLNPDPELNLYYRFDSSVHGRGLAREAARAWVAWGMEWVPSPQPDAQILPIIAAASSANPRSIATARSAGLDEVGRRRHSGDREVSGDPGAFGDPEELAASVLLQAPRIEVVRGGGFDPRTREALLDLWVATNDAGGAVGFLPGAPRSAVDRALADHEAAMQAGDVTAVLLRSRASVPRSVREEVVPGQHFSAHSTGEVVALGFWQRPANPLLHHRRTAYRIMTDPTRRGRNLGRLLMAAMHRVARTDGVEIGELGVRGGYGTENFYAALGWSECGRITSGIRVGPRDDRDDITMTRRFD